VEGGRDPDCRRAFPWNEKVWQRGLQEHIRQLVQIRKAYPALRRGQISFPAADQISGGIAWVRMLKSSQTALAAVNPTGSASLLTLKDVPGVPVEGDFPNLLDDTRPARCDNGVLTVPLGPWGGGIYVLPGD